MVSAQLKRKRPALSIAIIEPSETHYYQPAFTLVGAGTYAMGKTIRKETSVIPAGVDWIKDRVTKVSPDSNEVITAKNETIRV
jgi:sulfide:quinone oxidoreductase